MKLKLSTIDQLAGILAGIKFTKMKDRNASLTLLKNHLLLRKVCQDARADKEEIIRKFQEDWKDELAAEEKDRLENKSMVEHFDLLTARKDANKSIQEIFSREVDISLTPVSLDVFTDASWDVTLDQVATLRECGIIEG